MANRREEGSDAPDDRLEPVRGRSAAPAEPVDGPLREAGLKPLNRVAMPTADPLLHVVLYQPDIPQNTGNIGRSCVAVGAKLWLVRPLGFQLDSRYLRRAGMDYWASVDCEVVDDWDQLLQRLPDRRIWLLTKFARRLVWDADFQPGDVIVLGSETRGLPHAIRETYAERCLKLPMLDNVRSLNLASTANTAIYEAVRQFGGLQT